MKSRFPFLFGLSPRVLERSFKSYLNYRRYGTGHSLIPRPLSVAWFVTGSCNIECEGCFYKKGNGEDIPAGRAIELINEMADCGVAFLEIVGGEPLMRDDTLTIARMAKKRGMHLGLTTNGLILKKEDAAPFDEIFKTVFISIDGFREENDKVRGEGTWEMAMASLKGCLEKCKRAGIGVTTVMNTVNFETLPQWALYLKDLGVSRLALVNAFHPWDRPPKDLAQKVVTRIKDIKYRFPDFILEDSSYFDSYLGSLISGKYPPCPAGNLLHIAIFHTGDVSACCMHPITLGNIREKHFTRVLSGAFQKNLTPQINACPGCVRNDYTLTLNLFGRSPISLAGEFLRRAATGRGLY